MQNLGIFLALTVVSILFLLLSQAITVTINFNRKLSVSIDYFPIKLILYNFRKRKKRKKKLIKHTKRLLFFLSPLLKSFVFLLKKSDVNFEKPNIVSVIDLPPDKSFIGENTEKMISSFLLVFFYSISKNTTLKEESLYNNITDTPSFNFEFSTRFYNLLFAFLVFLYYLVMKKGRNVKIVR